MQEVTDRTSEQMDRMYRDNVHLLRRFLQSRCGSPELAADLVSLTFEQAFTRVRQGRGDEVTSAWLFFVARRRLIDHWRRAERGAVATRRLEADHQRAPEVQSSLPYEVIDALRRIRSPHRRSLYLKYVLDLPTAAVADEMGVSYRAAESTLRRARVALRAELDGVDQERSEPIPA